MVYGEYQPDVLRRLQLEELEILKDFSKACKKIGAQYFLCPSGTLIGTVRHKGFIPWDDDIDTCMMREDLDLFLKEGTELLKDKYQFFIMGEDNDFPIPTLQICKKGTKFIRESFRKLPFDTGIAIEVIPVYNLADDQKERKKQIYRGWFWQKLYMLRKMPSPNLGMSGFKQTFVKICCLTAHYGMKLLCISPKWIYRKYRKYTEMCSGQKTEYVKVFNCTYPMMDIMKRSDIFPTIEMPFEDMLVSVPNNYDAILKDAFGDYMQLPPAEKRTNHCPYFLSFGDEKMEEA